jgi:addiction module HigA family antidote
LHAQAFAEACGDQRMAIAVADASGAYTPPDMALRFEKAFGTSRQAWLNMQQNYDLWHAEQQVDLSEAQVFVTTRAA